MTAPLLLTQQKPRLERHSWSKAITAIILKSINKIKFAFSQFSSFFEACVCVCPDIFLFLLSLFHYCVLFHLLLRVRASLHMHKHSSHSCPQRSGSRNGSKVRQTTWEWTRLTISRKSLILFWNKEGIKWDIKKSICSFTNCKTGCIVPAYPFHK